MIVRKEYVVEHVCVITSPSEVSLMNILTFTPRFSPRFHGGGILMDRILFGETCGETDNYRAKPLSGSVRSSRDVLRCVCCIDAHSGDDRLSAELRPDMKSVLSVLAEQVVVDIDQAHLSFLSLELPLYHNF